MGMKTSFPGAAAEVFVKPRRILTALQGARSVGLFKGPQLPKQEVQPCCTPWKQDEADRKEASLQAEPPLKSSPFVKEHHFANTANDFSRQEQWGLHAGTTQEERIRKGEKY
ncbi:hypothetical protein EYF80_004805 [Liparis tanakae]|uniref:Uncharacterized protein n=1 Tax=Liparis tanakae TaxID=230148 RepID=A0A4Z2J3H5_9TELE|nr:hypothetical protein EYF80_004805 [Liparis tanakae]